MQSITRRWLRGSLLITICILAAALGLFLYYSHQNLYGGVQRAMQARFSTVEGRLQATGTAGSSQATSESRSQSLRRTVEQFDEKDKFEFMLLDSSGVVLATSSGTMNKNLLSEGRDFYQAVTGSTGSGMVTFRTADGEHVMAVTSLVPYAAGNVTAMRLVTSLTLVTADGEHVMAVTSLVPYAAGNVTAMRLVTSLTLVDRQWYSTLMVSFGVAAVVLGFAVFSGLFFIRTIVRPLGQVEATANRIAHGDLTTRLPDAPYDDEIGRLCKAINQMAEDLTKTERMKNEFISSVSHELRTPLTSIKGWVETIANIRDPDDENYRRGITIIRSETDRLYDMVEELLDFSRLQNGIKLNCEVLDFVAEATDAALFVEARIRQEGLHLVYDEPPEPYPVWADPARLRQVFVNVFDNAIKYSPPEGTIFFTLTRTATTVTASIRDQGRGIAPDDLQNVKMKFFKAKNAVRGSGIGLAVVDEITKALGGTADITSTLGQGTTVTITLPIYHAGQEHLHEPI